MRFGLTTKAISNHQEQQEPATCINSHLATISTNSGEKKYPTTSNPPIETREQIDFLFPTLMEHR